jgi:hypothetical protein
MHLPAGIFKVLFVLVVFAIQMIAARRRRQKTPGSGRAPTAPTARIAAFEPPTRDDVISNRPLTPK